MSLLIIGSCSKITQNIILSLAKSNIYQNIAIADLLPLYEFHYRYYRLRKHLNDHKAQTKVTINKIINFDELNKQIVAHDDILHVTHDYFTSVISKTKLMQITAELTKNVKISSIRKKMSSMLRQLSMTTSESKTLNKHFWTQNLKYSRPIPMPVS